MNAKQTYYELQEKLQELEKKHDIWLFDGLCDLENAGLKADEVVTDEQWDRLWSIAISAAGARAEEAGFSINDLLGKIVY
jgi:hypothetical protein